MPTKHSCCIRFCYCCFSSSSSDEKGQDPTSADAGSSPSAIDNTIETLPGAPKRTEAPIPGSSNVVTPRREMAGTKRSCCNRFCCFSSSASDEERQDHPPSAGPRSSPSAIDNTTETLPGPPKRPEAPIPVSSNVVPVKYEIEQHVDPNLDVSGTHQCDKAPLSESQNILPRSEGEDVNAHLSVSGFPQCDETSSSGPSNVSVKPEGEHVDVNPNVSKAPSSSYSSGATISDVIRSIKHIGQADDGKEMDVNLDDLVDHISKLLKLREEEMLPDKKASNPSNFRWPEGFKKLNGILSCGTDLKNFTQLLSSGLDFASKLVKSLMVQGKFICLYSGADAHQLTWFMRSAMEQFRDSIHFIHFSHELRRFPLENTSKEYYHALENTTDMEGTSILNLSRHETVRFIMRLHYLEEEMKGMDQSDKKLCELKTILHSLLFKPAFYTGSGSFTFFDKVGKMVGALKGEDMNIYSIFYQPDRRDKVQRLINSMLKEGGKEMHDEDSSLIRKMQTASASAVEQQNADVYFDALRDYISELWGVQLYQLCKFNKEGKKRSPPRVTWPTSRGLCRLMNLLSEGENEDWVKDVISRHYQKGHFGEDALNPVVKSLVKDIRVAEWAVAGLLAVADLLERFETLPSDRIEWLFVLEEMFRLAQYSKHFNQKAELWRRMKCGAIVVPLRYSIICCCAIDPSKFAFTGWQGSSADYGWQREAEKDLREECDTLAQTMIEDLGNESGSLKNLLCYTWGSDLWLGSEDAGGPSSEHKRSASFP